MRNFLLIFSVFFFFILTSCGEKTQQKEETREVQTSDNEEKKEKTRTIMFFGNSLTAGLGLETEEAFPALIQEKIDSLNLPYQVINAGNSGETTASGKNRVGWVLNQEVDIFVLELGANDGLRGVPTEETRQNLQEIIDIVREKNPETRIVLAGMQMPPNLGEDYTNRFRDIFPELAEENNLELIPFLLEDVAGNPELNQRDRIHPTAEGQKIIAETVWEVLRALLE